MKKELIYGIIGIVLGAFLMNWLFFPEITTRTVIETRTNTDTIYVTHIDTVYRDKIHHQFIRDTIILDPVQPQIKAFSATFPVLYGNAYLNGEVLGEVLKTSLTTDFDIPTITNTITETKTVTNTIAPKGLFLGAGIDTKLNLSVGLDYLDNKWLFSYDYQPTIKVHSIGISKRLF